MNRHEKIYGFAYRLVFHAFQSVVRTLVSVLTNEEQTLGLQQPAGIGQRPRPMSKSTMELKPNPCLYRGHRTQPQCRQMVFDTIYGLRYSDSSFME